MKIRLIDVNIFIVKHIFRFRFKVASLTRKSRIMNRIISKIVFEGDGTYFVPNYKGMSQENIEVNENVTRTSTIEINKNIQVVDKIVTPTDFIKNILRQSDDIVIMNKCLCRRSEGCDDYPIDLGCIFVGKTTEKISRKHCRQVSADEAIRHIDKCDEAGLIHIMGRNKMDSIWMNVRPGDELLTICNCCPCCCLWRVYPNLSDSIQNDFYKLPGVSVSCDNDKCISCKKCIENCYAKSIRYEDKIIIDEDICIGCGQCTLNCPTNAMQLHYENIDVESVFNKIDSLVKINDR
ncbi:MAG: 4Fe-4S binding protein [Methanosphaera sp.]|nr:4Fe-4S binding protein [Methanosphaera sp.]